MGRRKEVDRYFLYFSVTDIVIICGRMVVDVYHDIVVIEGLIPRQISYGEVRVSHTPLYI